MRKPPDHQVASGPIALTLFALSLAAALARTMGPKRSALSIPGQVVMEDGTLPRGPELLCSEF